MAGQHVGNDPRPLEHPRHRAVREPERHLRHVGPREGGLLDRALTRRERARRKHARGDLGVGFERRAQVGERDVEVGQHIYVLAPLAREQERDPAGEIRVRVAGEDLLAVEPVRERPPQLGGQVRM